jgi:nitrogen fixation-related uncharacterized protein
MKSSYILAVAIIVGSIILGGFFYAIQINKQESIEKQQEFKLMEDRLTEESKLEQAQKEYAAERESDCLDIYKTEDGKWNNIQGWRYSEADDECFIRYKDPNPKSEVECDELYLSPESTAPSFYFFKLNNLCKSGEFENSF